jgi:hypothetical protein
MIRINLTIPEYRHYLDLFFGLGTFKMNGNESPAETRYRKIVALESVIGMDRPRARIGSDEVDVFGTRSDETIGRWQ